VILRLSWLGCWYLNVVLNLLKIIWKVKEVIPQKRRLCNGLFFKLQQVAAEFRKSNICASSHKLLMDESNCPLEIKLFKFGKYDDSGPFHNFYRITSLFTTWKVKFTWLTTLSLLWCIKVFPISWKFETEICVQNINFKIAIFLKLFYRPKVTSVKNDSSCVRHFPTVLKLESWDLAHRHHI